MNLQIRRLSYPLGAEILGIDIREPLDDKTFGEIHAAFLEHSLLLFRAQPLTRAQHLEFSRRFGEVEPYEALLVGGDPKYPEIYVNRPEPNPRPSDYVGEVWHTDRPHRCNPPGATLLRGVEIPELGGDTMFANMYLAHESLSDGMKKLIEGLHGIHIHRNPEKHVRIGEQPDKDGVIHIANRPVAQPLARAHPETGRKALFLTENVKQVVGMTAEESKPLLDFLCNHATRPQFVYRHRWQKDDLLVWDDRCTMHIAVNDYDTRQIRHTELTLVKGTPSGYVYEGPV